MGGRIESPPKPVNAINKKIVRLKKGFRLNEDFKELWKRISKTNKICG